MAFKAIVLCASALFVQSAVSQCLGRMAAPLATPLAGIPTMAYEGLAFDGLAGWPAGRLGCGIYGPAIAPAVDIAAASTLNAAYGGGLPVATASPAAPTGLAVASENVYEGAVAVAGNLPFLGTVAMEGVFPTAGAGAVSYGCGDGAVAITAEGPIAGPAAIAPAMGPLGLGAVGPAIAPLGLAAATPLGYASRGCGCGAPIVY
ncbi:chorion class B protein PC10 [Manduca sexta]|uniref:chorion class B protein PC10 n=1 Tax=Manduca sexta TaxID=7130 RepID=UPI00188F005B|nr:chorion class B protein PC10 [Manduca sexta]